MEKLSQKEKELVAIGAAIASNCIPCIEYHIPVARKAGLNDEQLKEAVEIANKVKNVPAEKVLAAANNFFSNEVKVNESNDCNCKSVTDKKSS